MSISTSIVTQIHFQIELRLILITIKISKNSKDAVVVMSIHDYEALEAMKVEYLKHCFSAAKIDLEKGHAVDGEDFLQTL